MKDKEVAAGQCMLWSEMALAAFVWAGQLIGNILNELNANMYSPSGSQK